MDQFPPPPRTFTAASSTEKASQLLLREYPHRAIAIATSTHALIFRYTASTSEAIADGSLTPVASAARLRAGSDGPAPKCMVEFSPVSKELLRGFRPLTPRPIYGTLGLISINRDVFLCVITQASRVATLRPGETVERIGGVDFFCLSSAEYDYAISLNAYDSDPSDSTSAAYGPGLGRREGEIEYPYQELQKLLSNGSFYYSTDFDLTNRLQDRPIDSDTFDIDNFDDAFLWNFFMISPLVQFRSRLLGHERETLDASRILTSAIRGFCSTMTIPQTSAPLRDAHSGLPSYLTVISRLSCRRAGTRFNSRGIDDDGHVANFVETETIYWSPSGILFSYAQVRGSVPVFWEQTPGLIPGQQKIAITRSADGTQPAFDKHFEDLEQSYGAVHVVNLLSATKPGEAELTTLFHYGLQHCSLSRVGEKQSSDHALLRGSDYDFHAETKTAGYEAARGIRRYIGHSAEGFAYYLAELTDDMVEANEPNSHQRMVVVLQQEGVFRTNCLDCLDRTNLIQTLISQMAVEAFLSHRDEYAASDFWSRHSTLWADNGDALSRIYAGTGALKSSFTRHGKMSLAGAFADARKSATRLYINNFTDKARQNTIDMLLGRLVGQAPVHLFDPISDYISGELSKRSSEYSSMENIIMWVGTFNLNGRTDGIGDDLSPWLFPPELGSVQPEIMAVGFQEIVELSAQQIMNSDPTRKQQWERAIKKTLNDRAKQLGGEKYVLLRSGQLVGAALCIFVRASVLPKIKNVEGSVKKTGMSGIAGNKGAVAIRMDYANTQLCFVTAHLAAGFANYDERNKDYATIHHGLRFQRNRGIDDHDTVVWLGDFNYRIGLSRERVMDLIQKQDLDKLYENDQLNLQMVAGLSFPYYSEAQITFMPTYKFDIGTDQYDTSEKARIPAWTDRILRKGTNIKQLSYNRAPLRFSDHRPVFATFQCAVNIVDEALRERISRELYERRKAEVGHTAAGLASDDSEDDEDLIGYDPIEPGLPPASSDRQRWWLDNGKMATSTIGPPKLANGNRDNSTMILNPSRLSNPFIPTEESDWVAIPRSNSRLSSFSSISTSPYEHINHSTLLSTSAASNSSFRKLPPPYDPTTLPAKVGQISLLDDQAVAPSYKNEVPPPPPPRRQTTTSLSQYSQPPTSVGAQSATRPLKPTVPQQQQPPAASSASSSEAANKPKAPPPVAKKPAHLISTSPTSSPSPLDTQDFSLPLDRQIPKPPIPRKPATNISNLTSKLEASRSGASRGGAMFQTHSAAPRANGNALRDFSKGESGSPTRTPPAKVGPPGLGMTERKPTLPARPPAPAHQFAQSLKLAKSTSAVDLLGDDGGSEMHGWETLRPS
ncbi:SacI homology domain-containing protein [Durotheca rogersii]|uniref:SacI homology domain-containing protein n=1 Tax=Durotheca rogersii TaxID=419775 RepID=UPI00221EE04D|nr:SacI homology domain-containing protein [Durotheca rogersii]KAI5866615.1 SacI homology domain-containing protein [Durotheca rogersii]